MLQCALKYTSPHKIPHNSCLNIHDALRMFETPEAPWLEGLLTETDFPIALLIDKVSSFPWDFRQRQDPASPKEITKENIEDGAANIRVFVLCYSLEICCGYGDCRKRAEAGSAHHLSSAHFDLLQPAQWLDNNTHCTPGQHRGVSPAEFLGQNSPNHLLSKHWSSQTMIILKIILTAELVSLPPFWLRKV